MEPLLLHHHLAKNAGSSIRRILQANYRPGELYEAYRVSPWADGRAVWRQWYESLDEPARARLRCVGSHSAQLLFAIVEDRPVRAITVLRDPVERVRSLYNHALWQARRRQGAGRPLDRERLANQVNARGWTIRDIYEQLGDADPRELPIEFVFFFNGQARELLAGSELATALPASTGAGLEEGLAGASRTLAERYVVGTQDRFSESVRLFADRFGWRNAFLPRANVATPDRGERELDAETRELVRAYNTLDAELHRRHSEQLAELPPLSGLSQARWRTRRSLARAAARVRRGRAGPAGSR